MVAQPCPVCRHQNPPENAYCGACGAAFSSSPLVISTPSALRLPNALPPEQVKRLAATVTISFAALLAEVGLKYLQGRLDEMPTPQLRQARGKALTPVKPKDQGEQSNGRTITILSERVTEEIRWGRPSRRIIERFAWRAEDKGT